MFTMRSTLGTLVLATCITLPAFAEPPYGGTGGQTSTAPMSQETKARMEEKKGEVAPSERAAFRWESSADQIRKTQEALNKHGANIKADGVMGESTRDELRKYQRKNSLTETGRIDDATAKSLGIEMK